jgi:predicted phage terminase large subunit-like protein
MQKTVFEDPHRYIVFAKGRRCGGTFGAIQYVIECLCNGQQVLWIDTVQINLVLYFQKYFTPLLMQVKHEYWHWSESKKQLKLFKGELIMRSAEKPENIEGFAYNLIVINEAGIIFKSDPYLWFNSIRPMVIDYASKVFFVGTPKGKLSKDGKEHLFYTFWKKGLEGSPDRDPDWISLKASSYDNPLLPVEEIDAMAADTPAQIRQQEVYADFIDIGMSEIFNDEWWKYCYDDDTLPKPFTVQQKIISIDSAFKEGETNDFSAFTVWEKTNTHFYCLDMVMERLDFPKLLLKTEELYNKWKPDVVVIEDKASGQSLIQMFQQSTMPVYAFKVDRDKVSRATAITPLIEQGKVILRKAPWNKTLTNQCSLFPQGEHDDVVDSLSMALLYMGGSASWNGVRPVISKSVAKMPQELRTFDEPFYQITKGRARERVTKDFW